MITKDQAVNALKYLEAAAMHMQYESEEHKTYNINMRSGAVDTLAEFIKQYSNTVAVVYEYKLQRQDCKYLNKTSWDEKGKTYKNRAALMAALGQYISIQMEHSPSKPRFIYDMKRTDDADYQASYAEHRKAYNEWYKEHTSNREVRARYIPLDWVVSYIPVNTKANIEYKSAKLFYLGE